MKFYTNIFEQIISLENLFLAWDEFKKGKLKKKDVLEFEWKLEENIMDLHRNLKYHIYKHDVYTTFTITDPKIRRIHKATVRDRVLHHAIFQVLNPIFEPTFISSSFSCRIGKGNHKGVDCLTKMIRKVSKNITKRYFGQLLDLYFTLCYNIKRKSNFKINLGTSTLLTINWLAARLFHTRNTACRVAELILGGVRWESRMLLVGPRMLRRLPS